MDEGDGESHPESRETQPSNNADDEETLQMPEFTRDIQGDHEQDLLNSITPPDEVTDAIRAGTDPESLFDPLLAVPPNEISSSVAIRTALTWIHQLESNHFSVEFSAGTPPIAEEDFLVIRDSERNRDDDLTLTYRILGVEMANDQPPDNPEEQLNTAIGNGNYRIMMSALLHSTTITFRQTGSYYTHFDSALLTIDKIIKMNSPPSNAQIETNKE